MSERDMELLYGTAIRFVFSYGQFDDALLKKALDIDDKTLNDLIKKMVDNGAIESAGEEGVYIASKKYIHSEYLLLKERESDLMSDQEEKNKKTSNIIGITIFSIAVMIFFITCYFASRDFVTLLFIIPSVVLCLWVAEKLKGGLVLMGVLSIVVCLTSLFYINSMSPLWGEGYELKVQYKAAKSELSKEESKSKVKIILAKESVEKIMKDPSSSKFTGEFLSSKGSVCGYVNGKNSFGAYAGNQRFVVIGSTPYLDDDSTSFTSLWNDNCL